MSRTTSWKSTRKTKQGKNKTVVTVIETVELTVHEDGKPSAAISAGPQPIDVVGRPVGEQLTAQPAAPPGGFSLAPIISGLGWNTANQVASVAINLGLTPYLLLRLGVDRYGLWALLSSFRGLLSNLDGGLGPTSMRYFSVYAGAKDRRGTSSLLLTMTLMLGGTVGALCAAVALGAPYLTVVLHASPGLHSQATTLLREVMPLLFVSSIRMLFQRIISAEHRWAYLNITQTLSTAVYAGLAVAFVGGGRGLMGVLWASYGQEAVLLLLAVGGSVRSIGLHVMRILPRAVVSDLVHYSLRVQAAAVASSFNFEIDSLIVGLIFPVRYVAYYSIGSNFSSQLVSLPTNAVSPIGVSLSRKFGQSDLRETEREFVGLQRLWVRAIAAFPMIGAVSCYFAITRWLGTPDRLAGVVAAILLVGQSAPMLSQVMDSFGKAVKRPDLESRYLAVGTVVNIGATIPLAFGIGMLGVPIGTALGQFVSTAYFLRIARREISSDIRSFLAEVPVFAMLLGVATTAVLELPAYRLAPSGVGGLAVCALPAVAGLGAYTMAAFGPKALLGRLRPASSR